MTAIKELLRLAALPPGVADIRKLTELHLAVMSGHGDNSTEDFTSDRIAWLLDERSTWLK